MGSTINSLYASLEDLSSPISGFSPNAEIDRRKVASLLITHSKTTRSVDEQALKLLTAIHPNPLPMKTWDFTPFKENFIQACQRYVDSPAGSFLVVNPPCDESFILVDADSDHSEEASSESANLPVFSVVTIEEKSIEAFDNIYLESFAPLTILGENHPVNAIIHPDLRGALGKSLISFAGSIFKDFDHCAANRKNCLDNLASLASSIDDYQKSPKTLEDAKVLDNTLSIHKDTILTSLERFSSSHILQSEEIRDRLKDLEMKVKNLIGETWRF